MFFYTHNNKKATYVRALLVIMSIVSNARAGNLNSSAQARQYLVSIHTKVFGVDNLFRQKLGVNEWYALTDTLENYIEQNSRSRIVGSIKGSPDTAIMNALNKLKKANTEFVTFLQTSWIAYFYKKQAMTAADFAKLTSEIVKLRSINALLIQEQKNPALLKIMKDKKGDSKQEAASTLLDWALFLQLTVQKAIKDYDLINAQYFIQTKK